MKARLLKRLGLILGIVLLALILAGIVAPMLLDLNRYHDLIVSEVQTAVGGKVRLGRISWGIRHHIWLQVDGFSITDATAFPGDVNIVRARASVSIPRLLAIKVVVKNLQLQASEFVYRLAPSAQGETSPANSSQSAGVDLPLEVEIEELAVTIERLELDDALSIPGQRLKHVFGNVAFEATNIAPAKVMSFSLSLEDESPSGLGKLDARGSLSGLTKDLTVVNADLKAKASLNGLHMEAIKPYLGNPELASQLAGDISTQLDYEGDLGENLHARGTIDLSELRYSNPALWDDALPGRSTTVRFRIALDPQDLTAEEIALTLGTLTLDARGVVRGWNKDPVVRDALLSSNLMLRDLIPLIPWKQFGQNAATVRAMLEAGGTIALDKLSLPEVSITHPPAELTDLLNGIEMTARVAGVSIKPIPKVPSIENIDGTVRLAKGIARVDISAASIASIPLPPVSATAVDLQTAPKIDIGVHGRLDLNPTADEEFKALLARIGLDKLVGAAELDLTAALETARPLNFQLQGNVALKDFQVTTVYTPALLHGINAKVAISPTAIGISQASAVVALPGATGASDDRFTLNIRGRIEDWRSRPFVTLENFETSRIPLPLLSSLVPWETMDKAARPAESVLDAGGFITVEALSFPAMELAKLSQEPIQLLRRAKLATSFADITVPRGLSPAEVKGITGRLELADNVLLAENVHSRLGPIAIPAMNIRATDVADQVKVTVRARGPLQVSTTGDKRIKDLLLEHGLESLDLSAQLDASAAFDQHNPEGWTVNGLLDLVDAHAKTHPAAVVLEGLKGRVMFSRKHTMNITTENLSARINDAPVRLSGRILDIGSPGMLVSVRAFAKTLALSHLAELVPALKEMKLAGVLDMNLNVHLPYSEPAKSRLEGSLAARNVGFQMTSPNLALSNGNLQAKMIGDSASIETLSMEINDQKLALTGQLSNPFEPRISMLLTSPDLNLDRLLSLNEAAESSSISSKNERAPADAGSPASETAGKHEMPPGLRKLSADLQARIERCEYKGLQLEKLTMDMSYGRHAVQSYHLSAGLDEGRIAAKGSANLLDLDKIPFDVEADVSELPLDPVTSALGIDKLPMDGPVSVKGRLRGITGNTREMLASLYGKLDVSVGPGHVNNLGLAPGIIGKLSAMTNISHLFTKRLFKDLSGRGIPYESMSGQASFQSGTVSVSNLDFNSDALAMNGEAKLDLLDRNIGLRAVLVPLATVDEALHYVPLVGVALEAATKVQVTVDGPWDKPEFHTAELTQLGEGLESAVESVRPKSLLKELDPGLKKLF